MTRPLRYGLIGSGMMGREHIRNVALIPDTKVAAIYEPDEAMRAATQDTDPDISIAGSIAALLEQDLDALIVASPNYLHAEQMAEIASIRPIALLVEKPVCTSLDQARALENSMAAYPEPIWVAMEYRYMPAIARLVSEAQSATGGVRMLSIREHRYPFLGKVGAWNRFNRYSGGTLVEKCCHFFDLMCLILADRPTRVFASASQAINHLDETYEGVTPDIIDNAYVVLDFASGARALLELCMFAEGARYQEEITAVGPLARIDALTPGPARFYSGDDQPPSRVVFSPREPCGHRVVDIDLDPALRDAGDHNGSTYFEHMRFRQMLTEDAPVEVNLADGLRAVRIGLAAEESARTGQPIDLVEGPYALD